MNDDSQSPAGFAGASVARDSRVRIVCLGTCCSASQRLRRLGLKQESSFVEWMMATDFGDVLRLLEAALEGRTWPVEEVDRRLFRFAGTGIKSRHYKSREALQEAFARRSRRLRGWLENGDRVLFVRHDSAKPASGEDVERLFALVRRVNPACEASLLLFTPPTVWAREEVWMPEGGWRDACRRVMLPRDDDLYIDAIKSSA